MPETERPAHYGGDANPFEAIKIIEHYGLGFCLGNLIKYVLRAGKKDGEPSLKDLRKAAWYLQREIERLEQTPRPSARDYDKWPIPEPPPWSMNSSASLRRGDSQMPQATILLNEEHAREWLREHAVDVDADSSPTAETRTDLLATILVRGGMVTGQPSVMLAIKVDGRVRIVETSLQLLETACSGMRAASGVERGL